MLAQSVVNESGTATLTKIELEEALAGNNVNVSFKVGRESFLFKGNGLSGELELLFQLISTRLLDPAFREDAYQLAMNRFGQTSGKLLLPGLLRQRRTDGAPVVAINPITTNPTTSLHEMDIHLNELILTCESSGSVRRISIRCSLSW